MLSLKKYISRPTEVQAIQMPTHNSMFNGEDVGKQLVEIGRWLDEHGVEVLDIDKASGYIVIQTQRRELSIRPGTWILLDLKGHFHYYTERAFKQKYHLKESE